MLKTILKHGTRSKCSDFMQKFEIYAADNSFEISLLLSLSHHQCVSNHIRESWLNTFHALSRSIKIDSLNQIISSSKSKIIPEYNQYSHFIQTNLIPMIIDYEITNNDLISEIYILYKHRVNQYCNSLNSSSSWSTFHALGWIELCLFLFLNISHFFSIYTPGYKYYFLHKYYLKSILAPILLLIFIIHLYLAIKTFNKRRLFCYYLQCLSTKIHSKSYQFTPYILEGFNLPNLSYLHNQDYHDQALKVISPNSVTMYILVILSMKYTLGIVYCLCTINRSLAYISLFLLPIILGTALNMDCIEQKLNKSIYKNVLNLYKLNFSTEIRGNSKQQQRTLVDNTEKDKLCMTPEQIMHESASIESQIKYMRNKENDRWSYFWRYNGALCGYSCLMICVWPILLLTPFVFGFSILCHIDPGLHRHWSMRQFCRYWSCFMSIKVIIGMTITTFCDACWNSITKQSTPSRSRARNRIRNRNDNQGDDNEDELDTNLDGYNIACFTAMNIVSITVIIDLIFGIHHWMTQLFGIIGWFFIYVWLLSFGIKQIIPEDQRVMNWRAVFKLKWVNSNLLHTKLCGG